MEKVLRVIQIVAGIDKRLADGIFIGLCGNCWNFSYHTIGSDHPVIGVINIKAIMIEGGQSADDAAHDSHGVGIPPKTTIKRINLLIQHGVVGDIVGEFRFLLGRWQFTIEQEIADFRIIRIVGQFVDGIAAIEQNTFVAIDIGYA